MLQAKEEKKNKTCLLFIFSQHWEGSTENGNIWNIPEDIWRIEIETELQCHQLFLLLWIINNWILKKRYLSPGANKENTIFSMEIKRETISPLRLPEYVPILLVIFILALFSIVNLKHIFLVVHRTYNH